MTGLLWVSAVFTVVLAAVFWCWFAGWTLGRAVAWWARVGVRRSARRQLRFHLHRQPDPCYVCSLVVNSMTWCEGLCRDVTDERTLEAARRAYLAATPGQESHHG